MIDFVITITGTDSLLMHNSRLANPLDPAAKALKKATGKRTKTEEDYEEIARLEHAGGLYLDPDIGPYVPSENIWRSLYDGAKKHKLGVRVKEGVMISTPVNPLNYRGPRDRDGLWNDENFRHIASVKVGTSRLMRCRPMFKSGWSVEAQGLLDPNVLNLDELVQIANTSGAVVGLGDWRPRYGRYAAVVEIA